MPIVEQPELNLLWTKLLWKCKENYLMYFQNLSVKRSQSSCFKALLEKEETSPLFVEHQLQSPLQAKEVRKCNL